MKTIRFLKKAMVLVVMSVPVMSLTACGGDDGEDLQYILAQAQKTFDCKLDEGYSDQQFSKSWIGNFKIDGRDTVLMVYLNNHDGRQIMTLSLTKT